MKNDRLFFSENKFCIVKNAISEELRDFITQYALFDEMQYFSPEKHLLDVSQVPNAHSKYADPAMETVLLHIKPIIEKATGLNLLPTYSYHRVYRSGDELKSHTDRDACEISGTLCFNHSYNQDLYKWPIFVEGKEMILSPGDLLIYRGCELRHWRENFSSPNVSDWHVQGFFHYVDQDGPFSNLIFDGRESIGTLGTNSFKKPYITYLK